MRRLSSIFEEQMSPEAEEAMRDFRDASRQLHERYGLVPLRLMDMFTSAEALNIVTLPHPFQPDAARRARAGLPRRAGRLLPDR